MNSLVEVHGVKSQNGVATYSMLTFGHRSSWESHEPGNPESGYKKKPFNI